MRKTTLLTLFALTFLSLAACCQMEKTRAKILRPAAFTFPTRINKIVLVDRTCSRCLFGSSGRRLYSGPDTSVYSTLAALKAQLLTAERYSVKLAALDTSLLAHSKTEVLPPLSWEAAAKATGNDSATLLIVLEKQVLGYLYDHEVENYVWRVYDPESKTVLDEYEQNYENLQLKRKNTVKEFESGIVYSEAIYLYACRILPHWEWVARNYYTEGSKKMREATACVQRNDWENAAALWNVIAVDTANYAAQYEACYNLAVYHELSGNFDKALEWIALAEKLGDPKAAEYAPLIRKRRAEAPLVNAQYEGKQGQLPAPER